MRIPPSLVETALAHGAPVVRPGRPEPGPRLRRALARDPVRDGRDGRLHPRLRHRGAALRHPAGHRGRDAGLRVLRPHRDGLAAGRRQRPARGLAAAPRVRGDAHQHLQARPARAAQARTRRRTSGRSSRPWPAARTAPGSATRRRSSTARSRRSSTTAPMLDAYLDLGEWDVPVCVLPMPVPGTTGPGALLGNIALANAEALSSLVIFQLARPGRPIMYGSAVGLDGLPDRRVPRRHARDGDPVRGADHDGPLLRAAHDGRRLRDGCPRHRARGLHREADHDAAVGLGRGGHRGGVRRAGRRPDAGSGADPGGQRARAPRPAHGRGRGRARRRGAVRGHRGDRAGRQLPGAAGDPRGGPERRVLRAGADRPGQLRRLARPGQADDVRPGAGAGPGDPGRADGGPGAGGDPRRGGPDPRGADAELHED